jgi:hypothetical protein
VLVELVDLHHVGVPQPGDRLALDAEAGPRRRVGLVPGRQHLEGHLAVEGRLPRPVDHPHAAGAQLLQ